MLDKEIVVLGAGESGIGAALLAKKLNNRVFVSDYGKIKQKHKENLEQNGIDYEEGKHSKERILNAAEVIKSPGIPDKTEIIISLMKSGIPVISEIEFAARHTKAQIIAITGSNGKTTTTNLTYHLLKSAGLNVGIGGNVGFSFAKLVSEQQHDIIVLELSSFQLDGIVEFKPNIAVLLNITPDHLDRYEYKLEKYAMSKLSICKNQTSNDLFIYNGADKVTNELLPEIKVNAKKLAIGTGFYNDKIISINQQLQFDMSTCSIKGPHNMFNAFCAIQASLASGANPAAIQEGLNTFVNDPHRLEHVATVNGIEYVNDSKATNVDSVYYALAAMEKPIIWVVGGVDKGNDYTPLFPAVKEKVKAIICLGADNQKLIEVFGAMKEDLKETQDTDQAVAMATALADAGDVVLLSPACASFDLFDNYKHRGDEFKRAVHRLK